MHDIWRQIINNLRRQTKSSGELRTWSQIVLSSEVLLYQIFAHVREFSWFHLITPTSVGQSPPTILINCAHAETMHHRIFAPTNYWPLWTIMFVSFLQHHSISAKYRWQQSFTFTPWSLLVYKNMLVLVLHEEPQIRYQEFHTQQHTHPAVIPHVTGCRCTGVIPDAATFLVRPINN